MNLDQIQVKFCSVKSNVVFCLSCLHADFVVFISLLVQDTAQKKQNISKI